MSSLAVADVAQMSALEAEVHLGRVEDIKAVMRTQAGRRFVYHLLYIRCLWGSETFTGTSGTFHNEGKRSVACDIAGDLQQLCPDEWVLMVIESAQASKELSLRRAQAAAKRKEEDDD